MEFHLSRNAARAWATEVQRQTGQENLEVAVADPTAGANYEGLLRQAFYFLRKHDDGRYSSRTKMRVLNAAEAAEDARVGGAVPKVALPGVVALRTPFEFCEETEVKRGGIVAAAVVWPDENGRTVLAVHQEKRRTSLGKTLLMVVQNGCNAHALSAWVNVGNRDAQQFLLRQGWTPAQVNRSGGIQYLSAYGAASDDGEEDGGMDPLAFGDYPRPRRRRSVYEDEPAEDEFYAEPLRV